MMVFFWGAIDDRKFYCRFANHSTCRVQTKYRMIMYSKNKNDKVLKQNKQMFVKHLPPARSEYRVPQRPITKTGTKEGQLTQRYY